MRTLLISTTLLLTVISSVSVGIYAGYAAVTGILFAFGRRRPKKESAPALVSRPEQHSAVLSS